MHSVDDDKANSSEPDVGAELGTYQHIDGVAANRIPYSVGANCVVMSSINILGSFNGSAKSISEVGRSCLRPHISSEISLITWKFLATTVSELPCKSIYTDMLR